MNIMKPRIKTAILVVAKALAIAIIIIGLGSSLIIGLGSLLGDYQQKQQQQQQTIEINPIVVSYCELIYNHAMSVETAQQNGVAFKTVLDIVRKSKTSPEPIDEDVVLSSYGIEIGDNGHKIWANESTRVRKTMEFASKWRNECIKRYIGKSRYILDKNRAMVLGE